VVRRGVMCMPMLPCAVYKLLQLFIAARLLDTHNTATPVCDKIARARARVCVMWHHRIDWQFAHCGLPGLDLAGLLTRTLADYPGIYILPCIHSCILQCHGRALSTDCMPVMVMVMLVRVACARARADHTGSGPTSKWGCVLYSAKAQEELLALYHSTVVAALKAKGTAAEEVLN
jgi:hypothetical protein